MRKVLFVSGILALSSALYGATDAPPSPSPVHLAKGQSAVLCKGAGVGQNVAAAVTKINLDLLGNPNSVSFLMGDSKRTPIVVDAPYSVSAPTLTSYSRSGIEDLACVTITKQ